MSGSVLAYMLLAAVCVVLPWAAARAGVALSARRGLVVRNYRGRDVPLGLGWALVAWAFPAAVLVATQIGMLAAGTALLGLVDDVWGRAGVKGFRGHLAEAAAGRVTTGLLKLVGIGALALLAALPMRHGTVGWGALRVLGWLLSAAVIALTANLMNLLDLRPGRTLKVYGLVTAAVWAATVLPAFLRGPRLLVSLVFPVGQAAVLLGPVLAVWGFDLAERGMLGDMGANALGAVAGWFLAAALPVPGLAVATVLLLALSLASERFSFTAVIEGNGVLRRLDGLGRQRPDEGGG